MMNCQTGLKLNVRQGDVRQGDAFLYPYKRFVHRIKLSTNRYYP